MSPEQFQESLREFNKKQLVEAIIRQAELIEQQGEQIRQLEKRIEELERASHRQAAPFRIKESKKVKERKPPGRKAGHAGSYRRIEEQSIEETIKVPLSECPHCKGALSQVSDIEQIIEEIPPVKKKVSRLITQAGYCHKCQKEVYSTHPLQTSTASGAAKVQTGPNAKALALSLQYEYGLTKSKTCRLLENIFDLRLTPGGLVHTTHRAANKMQPQYEAILNGLRQSPVVHSDETSWYVGNPKYWLWVFANQNGTCYHVDGSRGRAVITGMIGKNYSGTLVSDCLSIYDDATPLQHKCYSHHLKAVSQAIEKANAPQKEYLERLRLLLQTAMAVKGVKHDKPPDVYKRLCQKLERQADELILRERPDALEEKIANRFRKQRDHLFTFLYHDEVDATNNLAERQLRPAVIARKISCGNKTDKGAHTWQILSSIAATARQQNTSFAENVANALRLSV